MKSSFDLSFLFGSIMIECVKPAKGESFVYGHFAQFYDQLMTADYPAMAKYYLSVFARLEHAPKLLLDAACGTGQLTLALAARGIEVIGVDVSPEMLSVASQKAVEQGQNALFLCQDVTKLDLYGTVDGITCAMDSVNHLSGGDEVSAFFAKAALFLESGGLLLFDMNTVYKHRHVLGNHAFILEDEHVYCGWQNQYCEADDSVEITLDFFEHREDGYLRSSACFVERAYPLAQIEELLRQAGLAPAGVFDFGTFDPPKDDSERVLVAAKKIR